MKPGREVIEVNLEELEALLERKREALGEEDYQKLKNGLWALRYLSDLIGDQDTTISQLRALLVKPSTEKTSKVLEQAGLEASPKRSPPLPANAKPKPGHGRNGAEAYRGARRIKIAHASLKPGDHFPLQECSSRRSFSRCSDTARYARMGREHREAFIPPRQIFPLQVSVGGSQRGGARRNPFTGRSWAVPKNRSMRPLACGISSSDPQRTFWRFLASLHVRLPSSCWMCSSGYAKVRHGDVGRAQRGGLARRYISLGHPK